MRQQKEQRKSKRGVRSHSDEQPQAEPGKGATKSKLAATDDLLAEIDEVLADVTANETAEQFVANYRQEGGE